LKKLGGWNKRHRQWTQHNREDPDFVEPEVQLAKQAVTESRRVFHGSIRTGRSLGRGVAKVAHGDYPLRNISKGKAILLLALLGLGIIFISDQFLKGPIRPVYASHLGTNPQALWQETIASSSLAGWNQRLTTVSGSNYFVQDSNGTFSAVAITKSPVQLDTVGSHSLLFEFIYNHDASPTNSGLEWGYFLTTNNTIPNETPGWDPKDDVEVVFYSELVDTGGGGITVNNYAQREANIAIAIGDTGFVGQGGTRYMTGSGQQSTVVGAQNYIFTLLNFTGNSPPGKSIMEFGGIGNCSGGSTCTVTRDELSWFQFQTQSFYIGLYLEEGDSTGIRWEDSAEVIPTGMSIWRTDPAPAVQNTPVPPALDTGGFFGPIIRALISIGVFILTSIAQFLGFVADAFVTAMNAVGGFFGLGAVGTAIRDILTGTANFIANVLGVAVGWSVTLASFFSNGIAFVTNFFSGSNGFVAWIISFISTLPGIWAVIQDLWTALNTVVLGMNAIIMIYYIIGMIEVYKSGWNGFQSWLSMGTTLIISTIKAGYWILKEMVDVAFTVKKFLTQWI